MKNPRVLTWSAVSSKVQAEDDKFSIPDQINLGRKMVAQLDGELVDELVVRGFSRDYRTLSDVVAATNDSEMDAFRKLDAYIKARAFDVFVCLDADRFGRKASLVLEIIDRITEDMGASIVTMIDNFTMDDTNALTVGLLKAFKAQMDIVRMRENLRKGMDRRASENKSVSSVVPLFHKRIRDDAGREIATVVNEDLRALWTDMAAVVLEGVAWEFVETVLFERYGHGRGGKPFPSGTAYQWIVNPVFWGHNVRNWKSKGGVYVKDRGPWIWDASLPAPPPVLVFRGVRPAVYSGDYAELGERVKAELNRRMRLSGKATSRRTFRFHGLLVCDECGFSFNQLRSSANDHVYMRCETHWRQIARGRDCANRKYIHVNAIQAYFHEQLVQGVRGLPSTLFDVASNTDAIARRIADEERTRDRSTARMDALIAELADAPAVARDLYRRQIAELAATVERGNQQVQALKAELDAQRDLRSDQQRVLSDLRERGVDWLWEQPDTVIHQYLAAAMGSNQLVIRDGQIIGSIPARNNALVTRRRRKPSV